MAKINFSTFLLYVNNDFASDDFCEKIVYKAEQNSIKEYNKTPFEFYVTFADRLLWIEIKTGKPYPYEDTVFDIKSKIKLPNPRNPSQAELRHQIFALYDCKAQSLYISNRKYLSILCLYLKEQSRIDNIIGKEIIKSIDEFCSEIAKIRSIRLVSKNTLFAQTDELFQTPSNTFGLGFPMQYKIDVTYDYVKITEKFKQQIKDFFLKRQSMQIDSFVCVGQDNEGLERYFNMEVFGQKIEIELTPNDKQMFSGIEARKELIQSIRTIRE